jgi:predicted membrane protein
MEKDIQIGRRTILFLLFFGALTSIYYLHSHKDNWKLNLVMCEFSLAFFFSYLYLKNDITDIDEIVKVQTKIIDTYFTPSEPQSHSRQKNSGRDITSKTLLDTLNLALIILLAFSMFFTTYCLTSMTGDLQTNLLLKAAISLLIAFGCIFIFGKTFLKYASGKATELSYLTMKYAERPETIMQYEKAN